MAKTVTFLQLSPEFGGTRFGPFETIEIRLGSDPSRNDITLPEALGVAPEHVKILKQGDGSFILAPVDRTATVFFYRVSGGKAKQIMAPMAMQNGDGFSLVTPEGPRFYVQLETDRTAIAEAAEGSEGPPIGGYGGNLNAGGFFAEIKRRGFARVLTTGAGNQANRAWTFIKTGQFLSPFYIIAGMTMASGWLMAGGSSCAALSFSWQKAEIQEDLTSCKDQLGDESGEEGPLTVPVLTRRILIDREWKTTIEADKSLYEAYAAELRRIFIDPERYRWVYSKSGSDFVRFKGALESAGMPPNLLRVVSYAAARPQIEREWTLVVDSEDDEVCGRGPLALTYRQGYRLGLLDLQLDALVERQIADSSDPAPKKAALRSTASGVDASADFGDDRIESAGAQLQGGAECLYVEGGDDRNDPKELATAVQEKIGGGARKLPKENQAYWIAARLTKLYAMDFKRGYEELVFDATKPPSTQMELENIKANRTAYAVNQAAAVIARAVAIPCLATLDKDIQASPPPYMGELPQLGNCAIVKAFVEYDRL